MSRKIIQINEEKCIGCGLCVNACQQSALKIIDGKAKLMSNDYCDGLGNCLPKCPVNAISFSDIDISFKEKPQATSCPGSSSKTLERPIVKLEEMSPVSACGCPGSHTKTIERPFDVKGNLVAINTKMSASPIGRNGADLNQAGINQAGISQANVAPINTIQAQLRQWPVQIKLVPTNAPYFDKANLLIAADCAAYAYGNFHNDFMKNRVTIIGCPKLDGCDYSEKISTILENNAIKSVTIVRMEVPCCAGIENAVKIALKNCTKMIPWQIVTISTDGRILE